MRTTRRRRASLRARHRAAGGQPGTARESVVAPWRARHSRGFAREAPASDSPAAQFLADMGGVTGGLAASLLRRRPRACGAGHPAHVW